MMTEVQTRIRKRRRYQRALLWQQYTKGHSTAPPDDGQVHLLSSFFGSWNRYVSEEWCEDVNHRDYYREIGGEGFLTLIGTMSRDDRGSPLWVRRRSEFHPPAGSVYYKSQQGVDQGPTGNWGITVESGGQIAGGGMSDLTTNQSYTGPTNWQALPSKSLVNFGLYSPKAWRRYQPLNPRANVAQFIGELRDLPRVPMWMFLKAKSFYELEKAIGHEYLNIEFGWKPFIKDVKAFCEEYLNFDKRVAQLVRDNGRPVHREGPVFKDESTTVTSEFDQIGDANNPVYSTGAYSGLTMSTHFRTVQTVRQKYWFSGTFKYYLDLNNPTRFGEQILRIAYGLEITPRLLWELMPWSWLIDWGSSLGDTIANMQEVLSDSLVASYAYTMGHYQLETTLTKTGPLSTTTRTYLEEVKARDQATPYGFGLNVSSFSNRQKAILSALALSR